MDAITKEEVVRDDAEAYVIEGSVRVGEAISGFIVLIVGLGVASLILIFVGVLGGQAYSQVEPDITAISDQTIQDYVKEAITGGFKAVKVTGNYLPLGALAVTMAIVIGLVLAMASGFGFGGYGGNYGGVL